MNNLCVVLMLICVASGDPSERAEQVATKVNVPPGQTYSLPIPLVRSHPPVADYPRLPYVPHYEPYPHYARQLAAHAVPLTVPTAHAISHAAPHPAPHVIHHATPYTTGPFSSHYFAPYHLGHNYRPFGPSAPTALTAADPAIISSVISAPKTDTVKQATVAHISGAYPFHMVPSFAYAYSIPITKE